MEKDRIFDLARDSIIELDESKAMESFNIAKEADIDLLELLSKGYSRGIREMGEKYASGEVFVPELLISANVMKKVTAEIESTLNIDSTSSKGKIVIGTVQGDVHDIGKGIVCSLLKSNGIEVFDIGREVPAQKFIDKAEEVGADYIGSSALLTTTMTVQKEIEKLLNEQGLRDKYKTLVGGAPVTTRWADKIGADAYCEDATEAVNILLNWAEEN